LAATINERAGLLQLSVTMRTEDTVVANLGASTGQHVLEKAVKELEGGDRAMP
jgi:hypothetical protein